MDATAFGSADAACAFVTNAYRNAKVRTFAAIRNIEGRLVSIQTAASSQGTCRSATPARAAASVAFHASAVAHEGEVSARAARVAFEPLHTGFRCALRIDVVLRRLRDSAFERG